LCHSVYNTDERLQEISMKSNKVRVPRSKRLDKKQFYFEHIKRWQESGLSQEKYCQENDVKLSTLGYWRNKFIEPNKVEQVKDPVFTQIKIKELIRPKVEAIKKHRILSVKLFKLMD
jgi:hypothetical protein